MKLKEIKRSFLVSLKKNPTIISFSMLIISFLVFSLNLTDISNTTAKIQGVGMGLCEFVSMLLSLLCMICLLNAFPKRQKPNKFMVGIILFFSALIIFSDTLYIIRILSSSVKVTKQTMYINTAQIVMIVHIVLVALTAVAVILQPLFTKLIKKIDTSVDLEETHLDSIELADEE